MTILERLVTFLPLGLLAHRELVRRQRRRAGLLVGCGIVVFAIAIEAAQALSADRHARFSDLIIATASGTLGVCISGWLGPPPVAAAKLRALLLALLVAGNTVMTVAAVQAQRGAGLRDWDCSYPLLVANELSADRPWLGRIRGLAIYPGALAADDAVRLATNPFSSEGLHGRQELGALLIYHFSKLRNGRIAQELPNGPELVLPPRDSTNSSWRPRADALEVLKPTLLRSRLPPRELCAAIMTSEAFAIEVAVASATAEQGGPARIVSFSIGPLLRNFTLGQELGALVVRVRTPSTGSNGTLMELRVENALLDHDWHHIVVTHADGATTLFMDGRRRGSLQYDQLLAISETRTVRLAGFALVGFVLMGFLAACVKAQAPWRRRLGHAYLDAALVPVSFSLLLGLQMGHHPDGLLLGAAAVGPALGVLGHRGWADVKAWREQPNG